MNRDGKPTLFRQEVLDRKAGRLHGEVSLAVPVAWQVIGWLLLAALVIATIFLFNASYSKVTIVKGAIVLESGVAPIVPSRSGVVASLAVRDGDRVTKGRPLAQIRSEEDYADSAATSVRVVDALRRQDRGLVAQSQLFSTAASAERARLQVEADGVENEIASIDSQIVDQRRLIAMADKQFAEVRDLVDRGFISRRDYDARESAVLQRRQQLSQLEQARSAKLASLRQTGRAIAQADATALANAAGLQATRAELGQQVARAESARGYTLTSPVAGLVTALTTNVGQPAVPGQAIMTIVPTGGKMRVTMDVPTSAIGFVNPGQEVRLAIDAFPYQRFGTLKAWVSEISGTVVERTYNNQSVPVYVVSATLERPWIMAFGRRRSLLPGMGLTARIITDNRSLVEWLFEPLIAVRQQ